MATIIQMPKKKLSPSTGTVNVFGTERPVDGYLQWLIEVDRRSELREFVSNLETARAYYREFPALVTAETVTLPEPFIDAYRKEHDCEPFQPDDGLTESDVFEPAFEDRLAREAIDSIIRDSPDSDPEALREYCEGLLPVRGPEALPSAG